MNSGTSQSKDCAFQTIRKFVHGHAYSFKQAETRTVKFCASALELSCLGFALTQ